MRLYEPLDAKYRHDEVKKAHEAEMIPILQRKAEVELQSEQIKV
jgi:hypothetical protein